MSHEGHEERNEGFAANEDIEEVRGSVTVCQLEQQKVHVKYAIGCLRLLHSQGSCIFVVSLLAWT